MTLRQVLGFAIAGYKLVGKKNQSYIEDIERRCYYDCELSLSLIPEKSPDRRPIRLSSS